MLEAHFSSLPFQSSIYGLTSLSTRMGNHKVLTASSKRKVYCIEYSRNNKMLIPSTREVQFTYIPGAAEIISLDAFNQASHNNDFVVGITFVKCEPAGKQSQYFNIYSDWEPSIECDLDNIAQGCLSLPLDFIPFQLTHTELVGKDGEKEIVWLLSGNDCKVHLYREDKSHQSFCEELSDEYFPEFKNLDSIVMWMDFITSDNQRLTVYGCKDGSIHVALLNTASDTQIVTMWSVQHDGPISCVRLFSEQSEDLSIVCNEEQHSGKRREKFRSPIHLLVCNTLEVSVVYRDILRKGLCLGNQWLLPQSGKYDSVTCASIADLNMDGQNELLLGTYGQQLLAYKWQPDADTKGAYALFYQQAFPNPLLAMGYIDITGDGLKELLVLSTKGLHILQHEPKAVAKLCTERLKLLIQRNKDIST